MNNSAYFLAIVTFILFIILLAYYESASFLSFDENMSLLFEGNKLIGFFHYFGETKLIIIITLILLAYLWKIRNYRGMLFAVLTIAFGNGVNQLVKELIGRPRPEIANQLTSFSFPSGHAMVGLLYLFTIAYLVNEVLTDYTKKLFLWIGTIILAILIGLSRVAEARHFGTDVLAGWFLGYTWFMLCVFWYERKYLFKKKRGLSEKNI